MKGTSMTMRSRRRARPEIVGRACSMAYQYLYAPDPTR